MTDAENSATYTDTAAEQVRRFAHAEYPTSDFVMGKWLKTLKQSFTAAPDLPACQKLADILISEATDYSLSKLPKDFFEWLEAETPLRLEQLLTLSVIHQKENIARKILKAGADVNIDLSQQFNTAAFNLPKGMTPFTHALLRGNRAMLHILRSRHADPTIYPEGAADDPAWQEALQNCPINMDVALKVHEQRQDILKSKPDPVELDLVARYKHVTFDDMTISADILFLNALAGHFFIKMNEKELHGQDLIRLEQILSHVNGPGLSVYDVLFDRYDTKEIFDIRHWLAQPEKLDIFFKVMPKYYQRQYRDNYQDCRARLHPSSASDTPFRNIKKVRLKHRRTSLTS